MVGTRSRIEHALIATAAVLDSTTVPWVVVGRIAWVVRGVRAVRTSIAVLVRGDAVEVARLASTFARAGFSERIPEAVEFARQRFVLLLRHPALGVDLDVVFGWTELEHDAIAHATRERFGEVRVPIARAHELAVMSVMSGLPRDHEAAAALLLANPGVDRARVGTQLAALAEAADAPEIGRGWKTVAQQLEILDRVARPPKRRR